MEFFDKKEDVIDLKLTQYGRHLLSKGKFAPVYYSFFDENVLYNVERAGYSEEQNDSEARIKETQTMQPQISISSLEKQFSTNYNLILSGEEKEGSDTLQRTAEKNYLLPMPIGTSDINSEYSPSWSVLFLNGRLSGAVDYINLKEKAGDSKTLLIPQLDSDVEIKVSKNSASDMTLDEYEDGLAMSDVIVVSEEDDMHVLLKVAENNGLFQNKNFDIEIFEIQEEDQNGTKIETLRPLAFSHNPEETSDVSFMGASTPEADKKYVDYYFDFLVDDEINEEMLCKFDPTNDKMGVFADPRTRECQDILNKRKKKVFDIYEDEADNPGEIC